jgi:hypothetical protein
MYASVHIALTPPPFERTYFMRGPLKNCSHICLQIHNQQPSVRSDYRSFQSARNRLVWETVCKNRYSTSTHTHTHSQACTHNRATGQPTSVFCRFISRSCLAGCLLAGWPARLLLSLTGLLTNPHTHTLSLSSFFFNFLDIDT